MTASLSKPSSSTHSHSPQLTRIELSEEFCASRKDEYHAHDDQDSYYGPDALERALCFFIEEETHNTDGRIVTYV